MGENSWLPTIHHLLHSPLLILGAILSALLYYLGDSLQTPWEWVRHARICFYHRPDSWE